MIPCTELRRSMIVDICKSNTRLLRRRQEEISFLREQDLQFTPAGDCLDRRYIFKSSKYSSAGPAFVRIPSTMSSPTKSRQGLVTMGCCSPFWGWLLCCPCMTIKYACGGLCCCGGGRKKESDANGGAMRMNDVPNQRRGR